MPFEIRTHASASFTGVRLKPHEEDRLRTPDEYDRAIFLSLSLPHPSNSMVNNSQMLDSHPHISIDSYSNSICRIIVAISRGIRLPSAPLLSIDSRILIDRNDLISFLLAAGPSILDKLGY